MQKLRHFAKSPRGFLKPQPFTSRAGLGAASVSHRCPHHLEMRVETALQMASYVLQEILLKH